MNFNFIDSAQLIQIQLGILTLNFFEKKTENLFVRNQISLFEEGLREMIFLKS